MLLTRRPGYSNLLSFPSGACYFRAREFRLHLPPRCSSSSSSFKRENKRKERALLACLLPIRKKERKKVRKTRYSSFLCPFTGKIRPGCSRIKSLFSRVAGVVRISFMIHCYCCNTCALACLVLCCAINEEEVQRNKDYDNLDPPPQV